jgi:hypothetical protein
MKTITILKGIGGGRFLRPCLVAGLFLAPAVVSADPVVPASRVCSIRGLELLRVTLQPTGEGRGASGNGVLIPSYAPTGVAVTEQGHLMYDMEMTFSGLSAPAPGATYIAWIAEPNLLKIIKLGEVSNGMKRYESISLNKFMVLVTVEKSAAVTTRSGPIVLRGISPSGLLQSFVGHDLFSGGGPC